MSRRITQSPNRSIKTRYRIVRKTLLIDLGVRRLVLSSAPRGGGLMRTRYILNHQVQANPVGQAGGAQSSRWGDPARDLGQLAAGLGVDQRCVGLMTAVPIQRVVTDRIAQDDLWVEGFITVGVTNAVKAGEPAGPRQRQSPGTINIILITNARLTHSALVGAVQVATEAKAAVLMVSGVRSSAGSAIATGTGTDVVVIACGSGPRLRYSGTHTRIGSLIAQLVTRAMAEGLHRAK
jgi:adenosylcobinamide hydrolase